MPEISRFYGIVVTMYAGEHNPPHFHVRYGDAKALIEIADGSLYAGRIPPRAMGLVAEWLGLHREELTANWALLQAGRLPQRIAPLR